MATFIAPGASGFEVKTKLAALALLLLAGTAQADIYRCRNAQGEQSIQDSPCASGSKLQKVYRDDENRPAPRRVKPISKPQGGGEVASSGNAGGVPVGLKNQRNKTVICGLLDAEKRDAQAQIAGTQAPPVGENPSDNLAKIEKQRTRVACDS